MCVHVVVGAGVGGVLKFWQTGYWMPKGKRHGHIPTFLFMWQNRRGKKKIKKERTNSTTGKSRLWNADLAEISKKKKRRTALKSEGTELRGWPLNYVAGHSAPPWPAWGLLLLSLGWPRGLNTIGTVATTVQRPPMGTSITFHGL